MGTFFVVNEHLWDRLVRVVLGVALVGLAATGSLGAWAYVGVIPLVTGALGSCPLYSLFGISTCPVRHSTTH